MNYIRIHNNILNNTLGRIYDATIHHRHHIIPEHEDPNSVDLAIVTIKEHAILHYLRWKITGTSGNRSAYYLLRAEYKMG